MTYVGAWQHPWQRAGQLRRRPTWRGRARRTGRSACAWGIGHVAAQCPDRFRMCVFTTARGLLDALWIKATVDVLARGRAKARLQVFFVSHDYNLLSLHSAIRSLPGRGVPGAERRPAPRGGRGGRGRRARRRRGRGRAAAGGGAACPRRVAGCASLDTRRVPC